jgi:hypothetical protein
MARSSFISEGPHILVATVQNLVSTREGAPGICVPLATSIVTISVYVTLRLKCDGTIAETRFRLLPNRTSPFKSAGASVRSTTGSRGVRISGSNAGCTKFRGSVRVLATHSIRHFPLHFPSRASPCAITFQLDSTSKLCSNARSLQVILF